jgi:hypothetical protein
LNDKHDESHAALGHRLILFIIWAGKIIACLGELGLTCIELINLHVMKKYLLLASLLYSFSSNAQFEEARFLFEGSGAVPLSTTFRYEFFTNLSLQYQLPSNVFFGLEYRGGHLKIERDLPPGTVTHALNTNWQEINTSDASMDMFSLFAGYQYKPTMHERAIPFAYLGTGFYFLDLKTGFIDGSEYSLPGLTNYVSYLGCGFRYFLTDVVAISTNFEYVIPQSMWLDSYIGDGKLDTFLMLKFGICIEVPPAPKIGYGY